MLYYREKKSRKVHYIRISILIIIILLSKISNSQNQMSSKVANVIMAPFTELTSFVNKSLVNSFNFLFGSKIDRENLKKLENENRVLKSKLQELELIVDNTEYLKKVDKLSDSLKGINAEIISLDPSNYKQRFQINKGNINGISIGDTVVGPYTDEDNKIVGSLVGKVIEVGPNFSVVSTIFDDTYNLSFLHSKTNVSGIINERIGNLLIGYLLEKENLTKGDKIFTSGTGGRYQKGIYIGEVEEYSESEDKLRMIVKIKTPIDISKIYDVFVIKEEK